jgi:small-conductance mechanosensitive channel
MTPPEIVQKLEEQLSWLPAWVVSLVLFALALAAALTIHRIAYEIMTRIVAGWDLFWRSLVSRTFGPARFTVITLALAFAANIAPLSEAQAGLIRQGLLVCFVALVAWIAKTALHIWTTVYLRRFKLDAEDNLLARKHVTQTRILRRVAEITILIVAVSAMLMTFDGVRQYGVSLLASAGAAGLVAGLALQPVLKNVFAGIQLAVTQPIRIDDAVLIEGEWGHVEEITSTYVVIRLWDWRRLILPLSYFMEKPFQNWTRDDAALIGTVMIYLDYGTPVEAVRREVEAIAAASTLWDRRVVNVQVTDFRQSTMEVRILVSAGTSPKVFDLRCEVREKLVAFLQRNYPHALPRIRAEQLAPGPGPVQAAASVQ